MIALAVVVGLALFIVGTLKAAGWTGAHFLIFEVVVGVCWLAGLWAYHRRWTVRNREQDLGYVGGWERCALGMAWPKRCQHCGQRAHTWREAGVHRDPQTSACAAHMDAQDARELAADEPQPEPNEYTLRVVPPGMGDGVQAAYDSLTDDPGTQTRPELDAGQG